MVVRSAAVRGPSSGTGARALALCCVAAIALSGARGSSAKRPGPDVLQLRQNATSLAARRHAALLDLYAIQTRLTTQRNRLTAVRTVAARVRIEQKRARAEVAVATQAHRLSQRRLAERLTQLYELGPPDPVAIVLGARSFDEAIASIDALNRSAEENQVIIAATLRSQRALTRVAHRLAARTERLATLQQQTATSVAALEQAQTQHEALATSLRQREQLTRRQIATLDEAARAAQAKTQKLAAAASRPVDASAATSSLPDPSVAAVPPAGGTQLTVSSTGYSLQGHTATGLPVAWGVAAVDPSVIPLGTRMTVPGYGEAVAADTGSAVRGDTIDLWFPTLAQARAWGRRTVTITLH